MSNVIKVYIDYRKELNFALFHSFDDYDMYKYNRIIITIRFQVAL